MCQVHPKLLLLVGSDPEIYQFRYVLLDSSKRNKKLV